MQKKTFPWVMPKAGFLETLFSSDVKLVTVLFWVCDMLPLSPVLSWFPKFRPFLFFPFEQTGNITAQIPTPGLDSSLCHRSLGSPGTAESADVQEFWEHVTSGSLCPRTSLRCWKPTRACVSSWTKPKEKLAGWSRKWSNWKKLSGRRHWL